MGGLAWCVLTTSTIINHSDDVIGGGFSEPVNFPFWAAEIFAYLMAAWFMKF